MFGTIRKHSQTLWIPIIFVIVISFVVYFTPGFDPLDNRGNRQSETDGELSYARQQVLLEQALNLSQRFGGMLPPGFDASALADQRQPHNLLGNDFQTQQRFGDLDDYPGLDYQAQLRMLRLQKAGNLGIVVGLNTAVSRIENMFTQPGSGFSQTAYDNFLSQYQRGGFLASGDDGKEQFREFIREEIIMSQLDELMTRSSGFFPDRAVKASLIEANKKYTAQAVFFSSSNHLASVTNAIDSNGTLINKHYETMVDRYFIEPKRMIGFVKISNSHYLPQAEEKIGFASLVTNRIKLHHSSTNAAEFFTDTNSTKKLPDGPALIAAARAKVREMKQVQINQLTQEPTEKEAKAFFMHIFKDQPEGNWTLKRLRDEAEQWAKENRQVLRYTEATVSRDDDNQALPQSVLDSIYGPFASAAKGTLYPRLIEVSGDGYFLIGLVGNIAGRPRKFDELNDKEKSEVKESFIKAEIARRTEEDADNFKESVKEIMEDEGQSFADSIRLIPNPTVNFPPMKLGSTNQVAGLEGLATLDQIHSAISSNFDKVKPGWISDFTPAANDKSDGFIVHVSAVEAGESPTPDELQSAADYQRQNARSFSSSMMAARFGMVPNWLQADVQALNIRLYTEGLQQRLGNIEFEIKSKQEEATETALIVAEIESGKRTIDAETLAGLKSDLATARQEILRLNEIKQTLPQLIKEATNPSSDSDARK